MARGGGGNFPGIVTAFTVRAFPTPDFYVADCSVPVEQGRALLAAWARRMPQLLDPARRMYSHVSTFEASGVYNFSSICLGCDAARRRAFDALVDGVLSDAGCGIGNCCFALGERPFSRQLLLEAGVADAAIEDDARALLEREQGWGSSVEEAFKTGAHVSEVPAMSDEIIEAVHAHIHLNPSGVPWGKSVMIYLLGSSVVTAVPTSDGAYGPRQAKWVLHYKARG
eukprot:1762219-Pleurochrysis_carterae.AAC.1